MRIEEYRDITWQDMESALQLDQYNMLSARKLYNFISNGWVTDEKQSFEEWISCWIPSPTYIENIHYISCQEDGIQDYKLTIDMVHNMMLINPSHNYLQEAAYYWTQNKRCELYKSFREKYRKETSE